MGNLLWRYQKMNEGLEKYFDLTGRTALITGGGSGIGKGCAKMLALAGAKIFIVGRRDNKLLAAAQEIRVAGGECRYLSADLTEEDSCRAAVAACISQYGQLDILINSAGSRGAHGTLEEELTADNLRDTMAADFDSTFMMIAQAYQEIAKSNHGSIINIASLAALQARGPVVYSAAKGAVRSMSRTLAKRLGPVGVRVNTIYPGFIITEMTEKIHEMPEREEKMRSDSPLHKLGEVSDIALCALYLSSDAARFVTGQDFVIDGGATC